MQVSRREFLLQTGSCVGYALGAAAFVAGVQRFSLINAFAQGLDYRALVCVFLAGGNDGNNLVVPTDPTRYDACSTARNGSGLAIARDLLLPITPAGGEGTFGLHPSLGALQTLWNEQKLSIACNVGPLVQPITRQDYLSGAPRPYQLFSHRIRSPSGRPPLPIAWGSRDGAAVPPTASPCTRQGSRRSRRCQAVSSRAGRPPRRCQ